jgi:hypothetical protein
MSESNPDPVLRFLGGALVAVGALIFALCGLCTAGVLIASMVPHGDHSFAVMALVIGGIPTAIGFAMMRVGHALHMRHGPRPTPRQRSDGEA